MAGKRGQKSVKETEVAPHYRESFLADLDGRVRIARTLVHRWRDFTGDLGGVANLSYQEQSLCKRAVHLERLIEKKESTLAHGGTVDVNAYLAALNTLSSLLGKLGLRRRAKQVPSLSDYVSGRTIPNKEDSK